MNDNEANRDDELSFGDFKNQLTQLRLFLRSTFAIAWRTTKRYAILVIILFAVFAVVGYKQYKDSKLFEAKASFIYSELQKKTYGEMLDKVEDMVKAKSYHRVASALAIPVEEARSIISISAQNIYGSKLSEDITERNKIFYVEVSATQSKVFDSLQYSIEYYLNHNVLVKELVAKRSRMLQQKIAYLKTEMVMMDSLKAAYTRSLAQSSGSVYPTGSSFNPVELYEKSEKIVHDITSMEGLVNDNRSVQMQDRFMVTEEPNGKSPLTFAIKYFALFLVSCIGLFFLLSIFKK
jgi:hypothetical protein